MRRFLYNDPIQKYRRQELRTHQTDAEKFLWSRLRGRQINGLRFFRQYGIGPYILDFYCPVYRLAIELDGSQHLEVDKQAYDRERTRFLVGQDITVLRFWNTDVMRNIDGVLENICRNLTPL